MKRLVIVLVSLLAFSMSSSAQMNVGMKPEKQMGSGMMGCEGKMPMMQMCQEMMKQKMGEAEMPMCPMCMHMMKGHKEMMHMMMEMMEMQEKIMRGVTPSEKKQLSKDMARMKEKMQKMMSMQMSMMGMDDSEARLKCAEEWLKKAIELHKVHIKDPKAATEASQMEMMEQMKKAYECITEKVLKCTGHHQKKLRAKSPKRQSPLKLNHINIKLSPLF